MIDVMRAVAAASAVHTETTINIADAQDAAVARALLRLQIVDPLAGVFRDLPAALERNGGEATLTVDF